MQKKEYSRAEYESPEAEIIRFDSADVITVSGEGGDTSGHETRLPVVS